VSGGSGGGELGGAVAAWARITKVSREASENEK